MASPQLENGYIRLANELYDAICAYDFSDTQRLVMLTVIRFTYGFGGAKAAPISVSKISKLTGIDKSNINKVIKKLIELDALIDFGSEGQTRVLGVNKNYEEWQVRLKGSMWLNIPHMCGENNHTSVVKDTTQEWLNSPHNKDKRKTSIKREHDPIFLGLWEMYPEDKRYGLQYISAEVEEEVVMHADAVKTALEIYVAQTDHKYLCKASKFFEERWKLVNQPAAAKDEEDYWQ